MLTCLLLPAAGGQWRLGKGDRPGWELQPRRNDPAGLRKGRPGPPSARDRCVWGRPTWRAVRSGLATPSRRLCRQTPRLSLLESVSPQTCARCPHGASCQDGGLCVAGKASGSSCTETHRVTTARLPAGPTSPHRDACDTLTLFLSPKLEKGQCGRPRWRRESWRDPDRRSQQHRRLSGARLWVREAGHECQVEEPCRAPWGQRPAVRGGPLGL